LRELLESEAYRRSTSKLTLMLGKTIHGEPYVADLATMPHLLIADRPAPANRSVSTACSPASSTAPLRRCADDHDRSKRLELGMYDDIRT